MKVDLTLCKLVTSKQYFIVLNDVYIRVSKKKFNEIAEALDIKLPNSKNPFFDYYDTWIKVTECDENEEKEN